MINIVITKSGEALYYLMWIKNYGFIKIGERNDKENK